MIGPGAFDDAEVVRLRLALTRLARIQRRTFPTGLTPSQASALAVIDHHGPIRLGDLARIEAVSPPTITKIVAKLEGQGLVSREGDPDDRRIVQVTITAEGHTRMAETRERRNQWLAEQLAHLGPDDASLLHKALAPLERLAEQAAGRSTTSIATAAPSAATATPAAAAEASTASTAAAPAATE
ncbi:MAG: MarR family transcriptional regulator [Actinomycetota bacterium]